MHGASLRYRAASFGLLNRLEEGQESSDNYFLLGQNLLSLEHGRILNSTSVVHSGSLESPKSLYEGLRPVGVPE